MFLLFNLLLCHAGASEIHWSFQPIRSAQPPTVTDSAVRNGIDSFVLDKLQTLNTRLSPEAERATLVRRVTIDLTGLPPTLGELDAFLEDDRPDAYERAVDRLLGSHRYGERWARPWLDLCHYADTDGYLTDQPRPVAWRYRSWLVAALNRNIPFDDFTLHQLAGDLMPEPNRDQLIAAGFLRQTLSNREGGAEPEEFRVHQVVDRTDMVSTIWLGLTLACARCHDHKYDPVTQLEFFEFYACLNNADEVNVDAPLGHERLAWERSRSEYDARRSALIEPLRPELDALQKRWEEKCLSAWRNPGVDHVWDRQWELLGLIWGGGLGEGQLEGVEIVKLDWMRRTQRQKDDLLDYFLKHGSIIDPKQFTALKLGELQSKLDQLNSQTPAATRAATMRSAQTPRENYLHVRGEFRDRGRPVSPNTPSCLPAWKHTGEDPRLALARWLVSPANPLTARVTVNRIWQEFFGQGLVTTPDDFGIRGAVPSHPALLDWLAAEFMRSGWNVKSLQRLIVTSATYRQSSAPRSELCDRDPENRLLARQNALRISSEMVRDFGLAVSGLLCQKMSGPSVRPAQPERVTMEAFGYNDWKTSAPPDCYRRGLYTFVIRTAPFAQGTIFDAPNPNEICARRTRSNTPLQALTLLNDPVFFEMAQALSERILALELDSDSARVDHAFRICLGRKPRTAEKQRLLRFLKDQIGSERAARQGDRTTPGSVRKGRTVVAAWANLCSVLLNLHEFITRD